ncbi:MAG: ATP synthase subunit I [Ilumatobacteraceae bacterium]
MKNNVNPSVLAMRDTGPSPEAEITRDIVKRGLIAAPVLIGASWLIWGSAGAWSSAYGLGLVLCNFMIAAGLVATTARISYALMMAATLFGYILRLGIVALAVMLVRNETWVDLMALGLTLIVTHLGLLFWEMRYVSASLAFPGLRPTASASPESISNEDISATTEKATV